MRRLFPALLLLAACITEETRSSSPSIWYSMPTLPDPPRVGVVDRERIVEAYYESSLFHEYAAALTRDGHEVVVLSRHPATHPSPPRALTWTPDGSVGPWAGSLDAASAVINLAGESIAARRWTDTQKRRIRDSRILATRSLVAAIERIATLLNVR